MQNLEPISNYMQEVADDTNVINDKEGVNLLYQTVNDAVCCCCKSPLEPLPKNWKKKIEKDYLSRKKTEK